MDIDKLYLSRIVRQALSEDLGTGDITTDSIVPGDRSGTAEIVAREQGLIAGMPVAEAVFEVLSGEVSFAARVEEGEWVEKGQVLAGLTGPVRAILKGERVALNFLQHLSGIATETARFVAAVNGFPARIVDTRKTTPGLRLLEKYAVRVGGGYNHRFGLYDAVLIKDNHIKAAGSISQAVSLVRQRVSPFVKIEVEVESLDQVREALNSGVDVIMLDNMSLEEMKTAVNMVAGKALVEASGGITLERVRQVAATGVDLISIGALTHSFKVLDISLELI
ncbi:carboxylating nicotinate-nucleotide diphosphorylase [Calderihabitans maritimus]|uniref:Probable nicotinate-nucleotide pyrophosphorylase [carboxylating] n=1 Tax=Calderihabitans maritimus TaxID=1246530 RepID=A0A1Z5HX34_9FIRM|nr:carboxylating nicotinate-nucleotide diphosphorylase [Calderihabitans maritimus]GAW94092.1 hypothetical protein KKC1_32080 [Calderihabitans maritimus]